MSVFPPLPLLGVLVGEKVALCSRAHRVTRGEDVVKAATALYDHAQAESGLHENFGLQVTLLGLEVGRQGWRGYLSTA